MFKSDFKVVADFFVKHRTNKEYKGLPDVQFKRIGCVLELLSAMTHDSRFIDIYDDNLKKLEKKWRVSKYV